MIESLLLLTMEEVEEMEPAKSLTPAAVKELEIWQRKAIKALKQGVNANCEFVIEHIGEDDAIEIRAALADCKTVDEIKAVFAGAQSGPVDPYLMTAVRLCVALEALQ